MATLEERLGSCLTNILIALVHKELDMLMTMSSKSTEKEFERMRGFQDAVEIVQFEYKNEFKERDDGCNRL